MSDHYQIDPAHSSIQFRISHLGVGTVTGFFGEFSGSVEVDGETPQAISVEVNTASVTTGAGQRDDHLRSADFFAVEQFPTATFRATGFTPLDNGTLKVTGDLTIRAVTLPVELRAIVDGRVNDPWGNDRIGVTATGSFDPQAFGLEWNQSVGGINVVGPAVNLDIAVAIVRPVAVEA